MVDLNNANLSEILEKAKDFITQSDYINAYQCCQKALEVSGRDPVAIELCAVVEMELGMIDNAKQKFSYLAENMGDNAEYDVYCNLGQLSAGFESVNWYRKALAILLAKINGVEDQTLKLVMQQATVDVVVSLVELYMTDLCFENDAEQQCEQYLKDGLSLFPKSPELLQTLASVRLSQQREQDAAECLRNSMQHWLNSDHVLPPSYEMRISLIRLLVETNQLEEAIQVGSGLERENDQDYELWYLLGLVSFLMTEQLAAGGEAQLLEDVAKESLRCFNKMVRLGSQMEQEDIDQEMMQSGVDMRAKLLEQFPHFQELELEVSDDDYEEGDGEMDWTDASEE